MSEATSTSETPQYVGFWIRFLAFVIDSIPAMIILALVGLVIGNSEVDVAALMSGTLSADELNQLLTRQTIDLGIVAAFIVACWIAFAATPGKMIFGAYIVDAKTLGTVSPVRLIVRYVCYYLCIFTAFLGFLWIAFDKRKQGLHDKIAGTVVIKGKPREKAPPSTAD